VIIISKLGDLITLKESYYFLSLLGTASAEWGRGLVSRGGLSLRWVLRLSYGYEMSIVWVYGTSATERPQVGPMWRATGVPPLPQPLVALAIPVPLTMGGDWVDVLKEITPV